ncbi:response regulator transcription factor [Lysobacter soyae]|uniref:Response regulator n=1 Tax=Lysobacter soyae TaxID=2764185 RepID=A0ABX8WN42_9GAMM|nr:response regulator [Lysobacter sp. CJ11]QYR53040.1 response regulator [Lysobacter sp. CJ11]
MSSQRVLLIEDEEDVAFIIRFLLERNGFEVEHATEGRAAMARLRGDDPVPDVVLMDVMLPFHDGLEMLEVLRSRAAWADVPVLMLTAKAREGDIVRALELGADDYVTKPFLTDELLARIRRLLRRSR